MAQPSALRYSLLAVLCASLLSCSRGPAEREVDDGGGGGPVTPADPTGGEGGGTQQCKKVDVLFVVDNSASMADNQKSLINSFAGFTAGLRDKLRGAESFHVGVVTSDAYSGNAPGCRTMGSLVTQTKGAFSSNQVCTPFFGGSDRFLTNLEQDLPGKFACVAQVGVLGQDDEKMALALKSALAPALAAPGACNAGFLRRDSLLVVVMITDEDDVPDGCDGDGKCMTYGSGGAPEEWFRDVVALRGGKAENIVVLSLLGRRGDNPCGAVAASRLMRFTNLFGKNGSLGDICAPSYDQFFRDALPIINSACIGYLP